MDSNRRSSAGISHNPRGTTARRRRTLKVSDVLEGYWQLYPFLAELQAAAGEYFPKLLWTGVVIDCLQVLSFALMPESNNWSSAMYGILQTLHLTHVPLYGFMGAPFYVCLGVGAAIALLYVLQMSYTVVRCFTMGRYLVGARPLETPVLRALRVFLYMTSSFLFVPIAQNLLALCFTRRSPRNTTGAPAIADEAWTSAAPLLWFPSVGSDSAAAAGGLAVCIIGTVPLVVTAYAMGIFMNEYHTSSTHPLARCNTVLDGPYVLYRFVSVVLFHYFVATDNFMYFNVWMAVSSLVMAILYMFVLPYYKERMNRIRVATLGVAVLYAVFSALTFIPGGREFFRGPGNDARCIDVILFLGTCPIFFTLLYRYVALYRVSNVYKQAFHALVTEARLSTTVVHVPKNLPFGVESLPNYAHLLDAIARAAPGGACGYLNVGGSTVDTVSYRAGGRCSSISSSSCSTGARRTRCSDAGMGAGMATAASNTPGGLVGDDLCTWTVGEATATAVARGDARSRRVLKELDRLRRTLGRFIAPYVDHIYLSTDVELATRFLLPVREATGLPISGHQARYAGTVFVKGIAKYPHDLFPRTALCMFLLHVLRSPQMAAVVMDHLDGGCTFQDIRSGTTEPPLRVGFMHWRLQNELSQLLHLREDSRQSALKLAKDAHREALHTTSEFWMVLMGRGHTAQELARSGRALIRAHSKAQAHYETLLASPSGSAEAVACFAVFSDHIRHDKDTVAHCTQYLRQTRSTRGQGGTTTTMRQLSDALATLQRAARQQGRSSRVAFLQPVVVLLSLVSLALVVALLVLTVRQQSQLLHAEKSLYYMALLRSLVEEMAVVAKQIQGSVRAGTPVSRDLLGQLSAYKKDAIAMQNAVMFNQYDSASAELRNLFRVSNVQQIMPGVRLTLWAYLSIAMGGIEDIVARPGSSPYLDWMAGNFGSEAAAALRITSDAYRDIIGRELARMQTVCNPILACVILCQVLGALAVLYALYAVEGVRGLAFALLRLIPSGDIHRLYKRSLKQHLDLDAFLTQPVHTKVDGLLQLDSIVAGQRAASGSTRPVRAHEQRPQSQSQSQQQRVWEQSPRSPTTPHDKGGGRWSDGWASGAYTRTSVQDPAAPLLRLMGVTAAVSREGDDDDDHGETAASSPARSPTNPTVALRLLSPHSSTDEEGEEGASEDVDGSSSMSRSGSSGALHAAAVGEASAMDRPHGEGSGGRLSARRDDSPPVPHTSTLAGRGGRVGEGRGEGPARSPSSPPVPAPSRHTRTAPPPTRARSGAREPRPVHTRAVARRRAVTQRQQQELEEVRAAQAYLLSVDANMRDEVFSGASVLFLTLALALLGALVTASALTVPLPGQSAARMRQDVEHNAAVRAIRVDTLMTVLNTVYYVLRADQRYLTDYITLRSRDMRSTLRDLVGKRMTDDAMADAYFDASRMLSGIEEITSIAIRLSCSGRARPCRTSQVSFPGLYLSTLTWGSEETLGIVQQAAELGLYRTRFGVLNGSTEDLQRPPARRLEMAKELLTVGVMTEYVLAFLDKLDGLSVPFRDPHASRIHTLTDVSIALAAGAVLVLLGYACFLCRRSRAGASRCVPVWPVLAAMCALAAMVCAIKSRGLPGTLRVAESMEASTQFSNTWSVGLFRTLWYPLMYIADANHNLLWNYRFLETRRTYAGTLLLEALVGVGRGDQRQEDARAIAAAERLTMIPMALTYHATKDDPGLLEAVRIFNAEYLTSLSWDLKAETDYLETIATYAPFDRQMYSTTAADYAKNRTGQLDLAIDILTSNRRDVAVGKLLGYVRSADTLVMRTLAADTDTLTRISRLAVSTAALAAAALLALAVMFTQASVAHAVRVAGIGNTGQRWCRTQEATSNGESLATSEGHGVDSSRGPGEDGTDLRAMTAAPAPLTTAPMMGDAMVPTKPTTTATAVVVAGNSESRPASGAVRRRTRADSSTPNGLGRPVHRSASPTRYRLGGEGGAEVGVGDGAEGLGWGSPSLRASSSGVKGSILPRRGAATTAGLREGFLVRLLPFLCYALIAATSLVLVVLFPLFASQLGTLDGTIAGAVDRSWILSRSLYLVVGVSLDRSAYGVSAEQLRALYARQTARVNTLYFGEGGGTSAAPSGLTSGDQRQRELLFSRNRFYNLQRFLGPSITGMDANGFQYLQSTALSTAGTSGEDTQARTGTSLEPSRGDRAVDSRFFCSPAHEESLMRQLSRGVGLVADEVWPSYLRRTFLEGQAGFSAAAADMKAVAAALQNGLAQSNALLYDRVRRTTGTLLGILIALTALTAAFIVAALLCVFLPVYHHLTREDAESRALMLVLPDDYRTRYPALSDFLTSAHRSGDGSAGEGTVDRVAAMMSELAECAVVAVDADNGVVLRYNERAEHLFGFKAVEVVGHHVTMLIPCKEDALGEGGDRVVDGGEGSRHDGETPATAGQRGEDDVLFDGGDAVQLRGGGGGVHEAGVSEETGEGERTPGRGPGGLGHNHSSPHAVNGKADTAVVPTMASLLRRSVRVPQIVAGTHKSSGPLSIACTSRVLALSSGSAHVTILQCSEVADRGELVAMEGVVETAAELNPDGVLLMLADGTLVKVNRAAAAMFGYEAEELTGRNVRLVLPTDAALLFDSLLVRDGGGGTHGVGQGQGEGSSVTTADGEAVRTDGQGMRGGCASVRKVVEVLRKDGCHFRTSMTISAVHSFAHSIFIGYLEDDVHGREGEAATRAYRAVMNLSPTPVALVDSGGHVLEMSKAAQELLQWPADAGKGLSVAAHILSPDCRADAEVLFTRHGGPVPVDAQLNLRGWSTVGSTTAASGPTLSYALAARVRSVRVCRRDHSTFPADVAVHELRAGAGALLTKTSYLTFLSDTTRVRRMDAEGQLLHTVVRASMTPVIILTAHGRIRFLNEAAESTLQYTEEELVGMSYTILTASSASSSRAPPPPGIMTTTVTGSFAGPTPTPAPRRTSSTPRGGGGPPATAAAAVVAPEDPVDLASEPPAVRGPLGGSIAPGESVNPWLGTYARNLDDKSIFASPRIVRVVRRDGSTLAMELRLAELPPVYGAQEPLVAAYLRDATVAVRERRAAAVNRALQSACPSPILLVDGTGTLTHVSPAAESTFGYQSMEVLGVSVELLLPTLTEAHRPALDDSAGLGEQRAGGDAGGRTRAAESTELVVGGEVWGARSRLPSTLGDRSGRSGTESATTTTPTTAAAAAAAATETAQVGQAGEAEAEARAATARRALVAALTDYAGKQRTVVGRRCDGRLFPVQLRVVELQDLAADTPASFTVPPDAAMPRSSSGLPRGPLPAAVAADAGEPRAGLNDRLPRLFVLYCEDITELRTAESQATFFRQLCRSLDVPLLYLDAGGTVVRVNSAFARTYDYSSGGGGGGGGGPPTDAEFQRLAVGRSSFPAMAVAAGVARHTSSKRLGPDDQGGGRCPILGEPFSSLLANPDAADRYQQLFRERALHHVRRALEAHHHTANHNHMGGGAWGSFVHAPRPQPGGGPRGVRPSMRILAVPGRSGNSHGGNRQHSVRIERGDGTQVVARCRVAEVTMPPTLLRRQTFTAPTGLLGKGEEGHTVGLPRGLSFVVFLSAVDGLSEDNFTGEDTAATLLRTSPEALLLTDVDGYVVQASPAAEAMLGSSSTTSSPTAAPAMARAPSSRRLQRGVKGRGSLTSLSSTLSSRGRSLVQESIVGRPLREVLVVSAATPGARVSAAVGAGGRAREGSAGGEGQPAFLRDVGSAPTTRPVHATLHSRDGHTVAIEITTCAVTGESEGLGTGPSPPPPPVGGSSAVGRHREAQLFLTAIRVVEAEGVAARVEQSLRSVAEMLRVPVVIAGSGAQMELVNSALCRVLGFPAAASVEGANLATVLAEADRLCYPRHVEAYAPTNVQATGYVPPLQQQQQQRFARCRDGRQLKVMVHVTEVPPVRRVRPLTARMTASAATSDPGGSPEEAARCAALPDAAETKFIAYMTPAAWVAGGRAASGGLPGSYHAPPPVEIVGKSDHTNKLDGEGVRALTDPPPPPLPRLTRRLAGWAGDPAGLSFALVDDAGTTLRLSCAAQHIFGWTAREAVGQPLPALVSRDPAHTSTVAAELQAMVAELEAATGSERPVVRRLVFLQRRTGESLPIKVVLAEVVMGVAEGAGSDLPAERRTALLIDAVAEAVGGGVEGVALYPSGKPRASVSSSLRPVAGAQTATTAPAPPASLSALLDHVAREESGGGRRYTPRRVFVAMLLDLSEQVDAVHARELHDAVMELCPTPTILTDTAGVVRLFNPAAEACFGWRAAEMLGRNVSALMPAKTAERHDGFMRAYARSGRGTVIGGPPRPVTAMRRSGNEFSATLMVREVLQRDTLVTVLPTSTGVAGGVRPTLAAATAAGIDGDRLSTRLYVGQLIDNTGTRSDEQLAKLTDTITCATEEQILLVVDTEDKVRLASPAALQLLGYASVAEMAAWTHTTSAGAGWQTGGRGGEGGASIGCLLPPHAVREVKDAVLKARQLVGGGLATVDSGSAAVDSIEEEARIVLEYFRAHRGRPTARTSVAAVTEAPPPPHASLVPPTHPPRATPGPPQLLLSGLQIRRHQSKEAFATVTGDAEVRLVMCGSLFLGYVIRLTRVQRGPLSDPASLSSACRSSTTWERDSGSDAATGGSGGTAGSASAAETAAARQRQEELTVIAEGVTRYFPRPFFLLGPGGEVLRVSAGLASLLGYGWVQTALGRLQGCPVADLLPILATEPLDAFLTAAAQPAAAARVVRAVHADGTLRDLALVSFQALLRPGGDSRLIGYAGYLEPVVGVRRVAVAERLPRALLELSPFPMFVLDRHQGELLAVNGALLRTFDFAADQLLGQPLEVLFSSSTVGLNAAQTTPTTRGLPLRQLLLRWQRARGAGGGAGPSLPRGQEHPQHAVHEAGAHADQEEVRLGPERVEAETRIGQVIGMDLVLRDGFWAERGCLIGYLRPARPSG